MISQKMKTRLKLAASKVGPVYKGIRKAYYFYESKQLKQTYNQAKATGTAPLPSDVVYETTQKCNLTCKMCFYNRDNSVKPGELTLDEIKTVFTENKNFRKVNLIGGEPMLWSGFMKLVEFFDKEGVTFDVATNGTLMTPEKLDKLGKLKGLAGVGISLDGPKELHNQIRGSPVAFQRSIDALKQLTERGVVTNIVCVVMGETIDHLRDIVDVAYDNQVNFVFLEIERYYIKHEVDWSKKALNIPAEDKDSYETLVIVDNYERNYTPEKLRDSLLDAVAYGKKKGVQVFFYPKFLLKDLQPSFDRKLRKHKKYGCKFITKARIDPNGNVIHCANLRYSFGNLRDKSFDEIWNGPRARRFRMRLLQNNLMPTCETCLYMAEVK